MGDRITFTPPTCAVCQRAVSHFAIHPQAEGGLLIEVRCHGSTKTMLVGRRTLQEGPAKFIGGQVFTEEKRQPIDLSV